MFSAEIILSFNDSPIAARTLQSVSPDNVPLPQGLHIETQLDDNRILISIKCTRGVDSFRATLEDLMSAISLSLRTADSIE